MTGGATEPLAILAAGGTGGHMFPAECLARELKSRGFRIGLVTDPRGERYTDDFPADFSRLVEAKTPSIGGPVARAAAAVSLGASFVSMLSLMRAERPAVAVGFGGYPAAPALMAARTLKIPYGVHEQNAVLGRANRMVAGGASFVATAFPNVSRLPSGVAPAAIGNPVRPHILERAAAPYAPPEEGGPIRLFVFGGSQGADLFARVVPAALADLPDDIRARLQVVHQVRDERRDETRVLYEAAGIDAELAPFFRDVAERIADAHLVVGRAGASTVTELAVIGRPAILCPLGVAMDDHQTANARVLVEAGAAETVPEPDFTADALARRLEEVLSAPQTLARMASAATGLAALDAAARLADLAEAAARPAARPAARAAA